MSRIKITLVIPTLNEIVGIREIMPGVDTSLFDQILFIDGGSTDGTIEYAHEHGYEVYHEDKIGVRQAYIDTYKHVRGDVIVTFSPDGNSLPELLSDLINKMKEGYDMVIVSRYKDGAKSDDDTVLSGIGNYVFTKITNILFGFPYTDAMVIYRAYKKSVPHDLGLTKTRSDFYEKHIGKYISWEPSLSIRCAKRKLKIGEIPGDEPVRVEDRGDSGQKFLPSSRIKHLRVGIACLCLYIDEFVRG